MHLLKKIFNFYINASIHVAVAVYSLIRITENYWEISYNKNLDYFIFFSTIFGYNYIKYAGITKLHYRRLTDSLKIIQFFSVSCLAICIYYLLFELHLQIDKLIYFVPFITLTMIYEIPFFRNTKYNLRNLAGSKIVVISLVWAGITAYIPIKIAEIEVDFYNYILFIIQRFLIIIVLTIPFDIRDIKHDAKFLHTIPQKFGIKKSKKIGFTLLNFALLIEFIISPSNLNKTIFIIIYLILLILLMRASEKQAKYYSSFWVEAIPILWWGLLEIY